MWERRHGTGGSEHPGGMASPLDNPVRTSLTGPHARFAERRGRVVRYPEDVAPFLGLPDDPGEQDWLDVAELGGAGGVVVLASPTARPPAGWEVLDELPGVQLVDGSGAAAPDPEAVRLGLADVPEMLDLVERTKPGPFRKRTVELGTYLGIRRDGRLAAMAGARMRLPGGWTEISAICTDPAYRGQGLAERLTLAVAHDIQARGERPFLATLATNAGAIRLYERLGFRHRQDVEFTAFRTPA